VRCLKLSQFICVLLELGCFSWFSACAVSVISVIKTRDWSEDRSKHDFATAKFRGIPFVAKKSTRSGRLFLSDGQYVGSPIDRCFVSFHHFEYFASPGCNESGSPVGMLSIVVLLLQWTDNVAYCKNLLLALDLLSIWVEDKQPKLLRDQQSLPSTHELLKGNLDYSCLAGDAWWIFIIIAVPLWAILAGQFIW
jgi:hypothetical protein